MRKVKHHGELCVLVSFFSSFPLEIYFNKKKSTENPRANIFSIFFSSCNVACHAFQVHTQTLQGQLLAKIATKTHFLLTKVATRLAKHAALVVHLAMEVPSAVLVAQANEFMSLEQKKRALIV